MTTTTTRSQTFRNLASPQHPLEPLTAEEIKTAVSILKREKQLGKTIRFPTVTLKEPDKQAVFNFEEGRRNRARSFYYYFRQCRRGYL